MKTTNKFFCFECGKKQDYYDDPNPLNVFGEAGISGFVLTLVLNAAYLGLPHRILRRDIRGFWFCKKHPRLLVMDVKRYKRKFILDVHQVT